MLEVGHFYKKQGRNNKYNVFLVLGAVKQVDMPNNYCLYRCKFIKNTNGKSSSFSISLDDRDIDFFKIERV
jgi:hypothetical protein